MVVNNKVVYLEDIIEKFINGPSHLDKDQIIYLINRIPSFDIINCKYCINHKDSWCKFHGTPMMGEDFCSYGEEEDEE